MAAHSSSRNSTPSQRNCSLTGVALPTETNCGRKAVKIKMAFGLPAATQNSWRAKRQVPRGWSLATTASPTGARHSCQAI
ncbi:hypothetical protein D3C80_2044940 [compost metagenome]